MSDKIFNVLFLCTGNSARSLMAEACLNQMAPDRFRAFSAGSQPGGRVHPQTLQLLERHHYPTAGLRSKSWDEFSGADAPPMDFVFTVCDQAAAEVCPVWPGQPVSAHWGVVDPVAAQGTEGEVAKAFADAFLVLSRRIGMFVALPVDKLDRLSLQHEVSRIGKA